MLTSIFRSALLVILAAAVVPGVSAQYRRLGNPRDAITQPSAGTAMMGGGPDLDGAFRWLCAKANGGDFLILRARGDDDYNSYVNNICQLNSVSTLIVPDCKAAMEPRVAEIIHHAEAIFIAGGDQANYIRFWQGTSVQAAINAHIAAGKPIGGTSAGLAVLGEFAYGALHDPDDEELHSPAALQNPFHNQVTLIRGFINVPILKNTITDSHFVKRDRMGRTLVFLARLLQDGTSSQPRAIAVDEGSAVLVEANGKAAIVGKGHGAYFLRPTRPPATCVPRRPLAFSDLSVSHVRSGGHFDLNTWRAADVDTYSLSVVNGIILSTPSGHAIY